MIIVFEGLDGSGKSTHIKIVYERLINEGYDVIISPWRRGKGIVKFLNRMCEHYHTNSKDGTLAFAAEFWTRWDWDLERIKSKKKIIIYDRYIYTEIARGIARGLEKNWLQSLYEGAEIPDITFFFSCSKDELNKRKNGSQISFFEAGFDSIDKRKIFFSEKYLDYKNGIHDEEKVLEAFCSFQEKQMIEYGKLNDYSNFITIDTTGRVFEDVHNQVYECLQKKLFFKNYTSN